MKACIWNIAGILNKDNETWKYLNTFDIVGLTETWIDKDNWKKIEGKLSTKFNWKCRYAEKSNKKGRAKGGIITGISKNIIEIEYREWGKNVVERKIEINQRKFRVFIVYSQDIKETIKILRDSIDEKEEETLILGGDWNARTGNEGRIIIEEEDNEEYTESKDKVVNREGRILVKELEERGWSIINGNKGEKGEYTYVGPKGATVIDYIVANQEALDEIKGMVIGQRVESDHWPLELEIYGKIKENKKKEIRKEYETVEKREWTEENIKNYQENCKNWESKEETIEKIWLEIKEKIQEAIPKIQRKRYKWRMGKRPWHDQKWKEKKRDVRKILRKWRKGNCNREEYTEKRKEYKEWCKKKKTEFEKEEEEKIKHIKTEQEVWKYINKFRNKREAIDTEIEIEEWREHFMQRFQGKGNREILEEEEEEKEKTEEQDEIRNEDELNIEEVIEQVKKLKTKKAPGEDSLENEFWKNMPSSIGNAFWKMIEKLWKEGGIPEQWKVGVISTIYKKGDKKEVKNYRGVTLMDTAYKVYASVLNERLINEIDEKLEENQFGFRRKRGVMDAIYVLNHIVDRELGNKGKIFACFADLKEAFDRVDRGKLRECLKKLGVSERLRTRIMETYKETINVVKVGKEVSKEFWTTRGVRQGCPMSPTLYNAFMNDLEEEMRNGREGGVMVGNKKIWTITYADDIVLLAYGEQELKSMLKRFKKYLKKKEMLLSTEKTKILVFENGKGRKREWKWEEEILEEVKEMKYLGYIMQKNGGAVKQIEERRRRAIVAMKSTWSIGERIFKDNYKRRIKMFGALVESVGLFGAEIWGWKKEESLDAITRKYLKWILGLDTTTPNYILMEECKVEEMKVKAIRRAIRYEEKARNSKKELVKECLKERESEGRRSSAGKWAKERRNTLKEIIGKRERDPEEQENFEELVMEKLREKETEKRRQKIEESRYNDIYRLIKTEEIPEYLKTNMKKKDRNLIARYRCGNEVKAKCYWKEEKERICRICGEKEENMTHVIRECERTRTEKELQRVLGAEGQGLEILKNIEQQRELKSKESQRIHQEF